MKSKDIDACCIGYGEEVLPCERELQDLGEYSACTVVASSLDVDDAGELTGAMLISFGPEYSRDRKVTDDEAKSLAAVINDVLERRAVDTEGEDDGDECDGDCESCLGAKMDVTEDDVAKLGEELKQAIEDFEKLLEVIRRK